MAAFAAPILGMAGDLLGGFLGSNAAKNAAGVEAGTFGQNAKQEIGVGRQQLGYELGSLSPYINGGANRFSTLQKLLATPGQGLLQGYGAPVPQFQQPTGLT